tara:strand:+ start:13480 stop:14535 length:1056 start_codon:yes stop_codon:yes gene_type:complete
MKQHEREYFTSRIRSGIYRLTFDNTLFKIRPLTLEQDLELQEKTLGFYRNAQNDGFLTQDELLEELKQRGLWTAKDENRIEGLEKDIDRLKVELFQNKNKKQLCNQIRTYLRAGKKQLGEMLQKKNVYSENSCEGVTQIEKIKAFIEMCCYKTDGQKEELYDYEKVPVDYIAKLYGMQLLNESSIRELARNEPWRSLWVMNETKVFNLFSNTLESQLTVDQKNLMVWSRMYDNVYESMDCPTDDVIEDDDMLDGWFLLQRRKREQDKAEKEIENQTSNSKISQSQEIFVFADNKESAKKINETNSYHAQKVKQQRDRLIQARGEVVDAQFEDQQIKIRAQQNEMYKNKFRR